MFRSSQRIGEINQWRNKYADQTNKQNHQHDAGARHQLQARLSGEPKPTHQHQQRVSKLQYMAATPEQQFKKRLAHEVIRHLQVRPGKANDGHRS